MTRSAFRSLGPLLVIGTMLAAPIGAPPALAACAYDPTAISFERMIDRHTTA
jgi:hypothetical protein